jgi:hypothetical protein
MAYFKLPYSPQYAKSPLVGSPPPVYHYPKPPPPAFKAVPYVSSGATAAAWDGGHYRNPGEELAEVIPEIMSFTAYCPSRGPNDEMCSPSEVHNLYRLIQHLNDEHQWTREKIADWLDTLDVDLTFKMKEEETPDEEFADS